MQSRSPVEAHDISAYRELRHAGTPLTSLETNSEPRSPVDDELSPIAEIAIAAAFRLSPQRPRAITSSSIKIPGKELRTDSGATTDRASPPQTASTPAESLLCSQQRGTISESKAASDGPSIEHKKEELAAEHERAIASEQLTPATISVPSSMKIPGLPECDIPSLAHNHGCLKAPNTRQTSIPEQPPRLFTAFDMPYSTAASSSFESNGKLRKGVGEELKLHGEPATLHSKHIPSDMISSPDGVSTRTQASEHNTSLADKRAARESTMTVSSDAGLTIEERREKIRLEKKRKEREREKKSEERLIHERNKKKPPLRLLSLDGGGVRGYTMILVLEELMHQCFVSIHGRAPDARKGERPPKPCEVFDLIGGNGIGGVIAVFLGRLRLSVAELKEIYPHVMASILERDKRMLGIPFRSTLFRASKLIGTLRDTIRNYTTTDIQLSEDPFESDDDDRTVPSILPSPGGFTLTPGSIGESPGPVTPEEWPASAGGIQGLRINNLERPSTSHRRKSLDDGYVSGGVNGVLGKSKKGGSRLAKLGFSSKKSLNDLKNSPVLSTDIARIPSVPKVDTKYGHATTRTTKTGHPDELFYDVRRGRCRTFVTAVLKGSFFDQDPAILRTYNSPAEPLLEPSCTIWQACAATTAIQMVYKPVHIGQHIFIDEGPGGYNPAPSVLKEASEHLWPGRDIGCFISIGTGKRAASSCLPQAASPWWEGAIGGTLAAFAAAKRRLQEKLDACEDTHRAMKETELMRYGVLEEDYFRFNVDMGWAEFDLNEWDSLGELNTLTKRYLGKSDVHESIKECGRGMAAMYKVRERQANKLQPAQPKSNLGSSSHIPIPFKAELPADEPISHPSPTIYSELAATETATGPRKDQKTGLLLPDPVGHYRKRETFYIFTDTTIVPSTPTIMEVDESPWTDKGKDMTENEGDKAVTSS